MDSDDCLEWSSSDSDLSIELKPRAKKRRYMLHILETAEITCSDHRMTDNQTDELSDDCLKHSNFHGSSLSQIGLDQAQVTWLLLVLLVKVTSHLTFCVMLVLDKHYNYVIHLMIKSDYIMSIGVFRQVL